MFPNAGAECTVDGVAHPVHGEVSSAPAEILDLSASHVVMRSATRLPLRIDRRISLAGDRPGPRSSKSGSRTSRSAGCWPTPGVTTRRSRRRRGCGSTCLSGRSTSTMGSTTRTPTSLRARAGMWPEVALRNGGTSALDRVPATAVERVCYLPDRPARLGGRCATPRDGSGRRPRLGRRRVSAPLAVGADERPRFPFYAAGHGLWLEPVVLLAGRWSGPGHRARSGTDDRAPGAARPAWVTLSLFEATTAPSPSVDREGQVRPRPAPTMIAMTSGRLDRDSLRLRTRPSRGHRGRAGRHDPGRRRRRPDLHRHARWGGDGARADGWLLGLGLAFDRDGSCFVCNPPGRIVRVEPDGRWATFADAVEGVPMRTPNFPVFGARRVALRVGFRDLGRRRRRHLSVPTRVVAGRGVPRRPVPLHERACDRCRRRVPVRRRDRTSLGHPPPHRRWRRGAVPEPVCPPGSLEWMPDGLALDAAGALYVTMYSSDRIYRIEPGGEPESSSRTFSAWRSIARRIARSGDRTSTASSWRTWAAACCRSSMSGAAVSPSMEVRAAADLPGASSSNALDGQQLVLGVRVLISVVPFAKGRQDAAGGLLRVDPRQLLGRARVPRIERLEDRPMGLPGRLDRAARPRRDRVESGGPHPRGQGSA